MANKEHLDILKQGVETWNQWRQMHLDILPDLSGAKLSRAAPWESLSDADFRRDANLSGADLSEANLSEANLSGANLSGADLNRTSLIATNLREANLTRCTIYGIAVWNVDLEGAIQDSLVITPDNEPTITVDNLKIAQFIY